MILHCNNCLTEDKELILYDNAPTIYLCISCFLKENQEEINSLKQSVEYLQNQIDRERS